jgi:hypothetical protein
MTKEEIKKFVDDGFSFDDMLRDRFPKDSEIIYMNDYGNLVKCKVISFLPRVTACGNRTLKVFNHSTNEEEFISVLNNII